MNEQPNTWTPVLSSSMLTGYRYDAATQQLDITFPKGKPGEYYRYFGVPKETFDAFRDADSKGKYFLAHIRKGDFKFERLTEATAETEVQA